MNSDFENKWEPTTEYTHMVEREEQFSNYKLERATNKELEMLNSPSPIFDALFKFIKNNNNYKKIKNVNKTYTKKNIKLC